MSEKDVKDNETEALNNDAAENADIEAGETDMATSIESVDFAVVYDDGGDSIATESAENAENTEGIATEDSVASDNANRVNETLALGATDDEQSLDQHETVQADSATSVSSQIDREIKHHRKKDAFFFKANPTFALDHVTVHNRKTGRDVLDDVSLAFHAGATHAVLVDAEDVEQHQALGGHHGRHDADDQRQRDAQKHEPRRRDTGRRAWTPHRFHSAAVRRARRP